MQCSLCVSRCNMGSFSNLSAALVLRSFADMTPAGLEPAIPGSVGRCLIHWATGPLLSVVLRGVVFLCNCIHCNLGFLSARLVRRS